jgi:flavorubredoxin
MHPEDRAVIEQNTNNFVGITREIFWVGFSEDHSRLRCNPYLLIDSTGNDVVFFDPGSIPDFPSVMRKVIDLVPPERITWIVASHQDPDVCGNLPVVEDVIDSDRLRIAAHTNTIRLIAHLGLRSEFYAIDKNDYLITLDSGRTLDVLFMPFLHSPGAVATYDRRTKTLFSGDLFGGVTNDVSLFEARDFPRSMDSFHQAYMPTNRVLRPAMEKLERLEIERILPQHGSIIEASNVAVAIEHLKNLPCGIDLEAE